MKTIRYTLGILLLAHQILIGLTHEGFHDGMRQLWNDHGVWTREYVIAALADLPNLDIAAKRLFKNQEDIGSALVPFYGQAAGKQLTALLKDHIKIAADVVAAAKKGDAKALKEHNERWHTNARDISSFIAKANPHISQKALQAMMYDHLALLTKVVTARLQKNWSQDTTKYDAYRTQLNHMADALSEGIMKQFPEKFTTTPRAKTPVAQKTQKPSGKAKL